MDGGEEGVRVQHSSVEHVVTACVGGLHTLMQPLISMQSLDWIMSLSAFDRSWSWSPLVSVWLRSRSLPADAPSEEDLRKHLLQIDLWWSYQPTGDRTMCRGGTELQQTEDRPWPSGGWTAVIRLSLRFKAAVMVLILFTGRADMREMLCVVWYKLRGLFGWSISQLSCLNCTGKRAVWEEKAHRVFWPLKFKMVSLSGLKQTFKNFKPQLRLWPKPRLSQELLVK